MNALIASNYWMRKKRKASTHGTKELKETGLIKLNNLQTCESRVVK